MLILPVVTRELVTQSRRSGTYWMRVAVSAVAGLLTFWILLVGATSMPTLSQGKMLFSILSFLAFVYCLLVGALATADCLSAEKREGTIGLLFLTTLKGHDIVLGKLVSASLRCVYGLLAVVPMMSMALLFGGVSGREITGTALVLANTLFFSLAAGLFVSTISRDERKACFATVLLIAAVAGGPYVVGYFLTNPATRYTSGVADGALTPSPAFAFTLAQSANRPPNWALYNSLAETHCLAWLLLGLAGLIAPKVCREQPEGPRRQRWSAWVRRWKFGTEVERAIWRRRLLERNPSDWLSSRERHKAGLVWLLIGALMGLEGWLCLSYRSVFYECSLWFLLPLHVLLKIWFAVEVCRRWIEDRQSGALELLLCTPLHTRDFLRGQSLALWRQFGWPMLVTIALTLASWIVIWRQSGLSPATRFGRTWLLLGVVALVADGAALRWVGAWRGLIEPSLNRASMGTLGRVLALRWILFGLCAGITGALHWIGLAQYHFFQEEWFWLALALFLDLLLGLSARRKFLGCFRAVASNPAGYGEAVRMMAVEAALATAPDPWAQRAEVERRLRARRRRRIAWAMALAALVLAVPVGYRWRLKWQVDHRIRALRQAGFPVSVAELERRRPAVASGVDAGKVLERAFPMLVPSYRLPPQISSLLPDGWRPMGPISSEPLPADLKEAIWAFLATNMMALQILHAAPELSQGSYANYWQTGSGNFAAQMGSLPVVSQLLEMEVWFRADEHDVPGALESLLRLLELNHPLNRSALLLGPLPRMCADRGFVALERLINQCALDDSALQELGQELPALERAADPKEAVDRIRCVAIDLYRTPLAAQLRAAGARPPPGTSLLQMQMQERLLRLTGAVERALLSGLATLDEFGRIVQAPWPERLAQARLLVTARPGLGSQAARQPWDGWMRQYLSDWWMRQYLSASFFLNNLIRPNAELTARCRSVTTSLAIERYRLRHGGSLPERLDQLVPEFLRELPPDPFTGQPLRYRRLAKGYCVYSVGNNGKDEGGWGPGNRPYSYSVSWPPSVANDDIGFMVER